MATPVEVPKLGNTVEDCLVTSWLKHKGDNVAAGEVLAEIETDKTTFELTSPVDGVVLEIFFEQGALVPVFSVVCAIGSPGETVSGPAPGARPVPPGSAPDPLPDAPAPPQTGAGLAVPVGTQQVAEVARTVGGNGQASPRQAPLSPRARRFAREHEMSPASTKGTGPGGRVLEDDLVRLWHAQSRTQQPALSVPTASSVPTAQSVPPASSVPTASSVPMTPVRQRIAKRLRESLISTAQYTLHGSANAAGLLALRKRMKASAAAADVNINDLVAFCTVRALVEMPAVNAELIDGVVHRHSAVHLGFACDTERGLVVPVVRDAQDLSLVGLARRMKDLASRAGAGSIAVDDLNGGTFTVSNLGALGVESFTPVLNPPQVAVLGVGAIGLKAVRKPDGNVELIDSIGLSLTLDHQVVDGAPGARFLAVVRDKIEHAEATCTI
jgi:pyruvate dehydrogenase E2 component (dihydrolipoamide acetyltransferase)